MKRSGSNDKILPPEILGCDVNSFASYTLKNRLPHIIEQIIIDNNLKSNEVEELQKLSTEIAMGEIRALNWNNDTDSLQWNSCVEPYLGKTWFEVPFFFAEMYFYRRVLEAIDYFTACSNDVIDPYKARKERELYSALLHVKEYADVLEVSRASHQDPLKYLEFFLSATLWSNRADLSQLPRDIEIKNYGVIGSELSSLLINDLSGVSSLIRERECLSRLDVILDNSGTELLADLALVCYLLESDLAKSIYLHCKAYPVFVSDATMTDIEFTLDCLKNNSLPQVREWANKLQLLIDQGRLVLCNHKFWTLPLYFQDIPDDLSSRLKSSDLVIVKGDANYRRLVEDRHWPISTPLSDTVAYFPSSCLILRVLKSELLVGADPEYLASCHLPDDWMTSGKFGTVQLSIAR